MDKCKVKLTLHYTYNHDKSVEKQSPVKNNGAFFVSLQLNY